MQNALSSVFLSVFFCGSLYPDSEHSSWTVEVELFFDVFVASKGLVHLSIPLLQSEAEFQLSLTPGQSKKSFVLQLNQVRSGPVCFIMTTPCHFNIHFRGNITFITVILVSFR